MSMLILIGLMMMFAATAVPMRFAADANDAPTGGAPDPVTEPDAKPEGTTDTDDGEGEGGGTYEPGEEETSEDTDIDGMIVEGSEITAENIGAKPKATPKAAEADPEEIAEPQEPEPEPKAPEPVKAKLSDDILKEAQGYGIDAADLDGMDDVSARKHMISVDKTLAKIGAKALMTTPIQEPGQQPQQQQTPLAPQQAAQPTQPQQPVPFEAYKLKLKKEEYDEMVVAELEGMSSHYQAQIDQLRSAITPLYQSEESRQIQQVVSAFDNEFAAMGPEWKDVLGEGPTFGMPKDSPQRKLRERIMPTAKSILESLQRSTGNLNPVTFDALVRRAINAEAGDKVVEIERKRLAKAIGPRKGATVNRPSQRVRDLPIGESKALQTVRQKMKAYGLHEDESDLE